MTEGMVNVDELHKKVTSCLNTVKLGVAGRLVCFDELSRMFILAMHTTSPEATHEATQLAWDSIPEELKGELSKAGIGFSGKQI